MSNTLNALMALVRKDLILHFSNRRALIMGLVAPIAIAAFFGYLFDPRTSRPTRIAVVLTDLDQSALSREVVAALFADPALQLTEAGQAEALDAVRNGRAKAAVVLPQGLANNAPRAMFGGGTKPRIEVLHDPSQAMALSVVRGLLAQTVTQAVGRRALSGVPAAAAAAADSVPAERRQDLQQGPAPTQRVQRAAAPADGASAPAAGMTMSSPFELHAQEAQAAGGHAYNGYAHSFAGMGVQFILFAGIEFGVGLLLTRRLGLWKRLRAAPISRTLPLGSRIASAALISALLLAAIFAAAIAFFGVRIEGSVFGFAAVGAAFALMTAAFGMLIAALGRTPEATRGLAILATLVMVMLGGAWVPSFLLPEWVQTLAMAMPARWAVDGLDAMTWRGLGLEAAWPPVLALLGFALAFTALAVWRFDWEE